ncbi:hypothetical protein O0544_10530 [Edwardsiella anguillarum]|nr:hypothetical protein [Edwardsiella anguillarum]
MTDPLSPLPHGVTPAPILSVQDVDHGYEQAHGVQTILQGLT